MSNENSIYCHDCQKILKNWIEFQLVDEQGKPLVGIPYKLKSRANQRTGKTDGKGILREEYLPSTPITDPDAKEYKGTMKNKNEALRGYKRSQELIIKNPFALNKKETKIYGIKYSDVLNHINKRIIALEGN
ncbi:hypothetical protein WDV76_18220 [Xenorhabdus griffiniae]|uniref:hypothetical protein n=1 Tax=Xenorhabdus griffiniae TaxID=351672 RepID=UPI0023593836|nr:hypothetical protein [Xenorhabdus griffiniae]MDC9604740.1 hypothetical protein [Xenorhabdus griffiniae]